METLLRKYMWLLDGVAIALAATFLALSAAGAVEANLAVPAVKPAPRAPRSSGATVYRKEIEPILKRNIFCSDCPPILQVDTPATAQTSSEAQRTSLPLALLAIMYSPPPMGLKWSVAVVKDSEDKSMGAFPVGAKLRGATLTEIAETRIYLDNAGRTEYLDLLDTPAPVAAVDSPPAATSGAPADDFTAELDRGIKKTGEHTFDVQRSTLESVLGNMNMLSRSARIVPEVRDGKAAGFRLYSVRPEGPFAKIGMQNGDVIHSINGLEMSSPEKALEVYSKLKSASHLSVGVERGGAKITKEYNIR